MYQQSRCKTLKQVKVLNLLMLPSPIYLPDLTHEDAALGTTVISCTSGHDRFTQIFLYVSFNSRPINSFRTNLHIHFFTFSRSFFLDIYLTHRILQALFFKHVIIHDIIFSVIHCLQYNLRLTDCLDYCHIILQQLDWNWNTRLSVEQVYHQSKQLLSLHHYFYPV